MHGLYQGFEVSTGRGDSENIREVDFAVGDILRGVVGLLHMQIVADIETDALHELWRAAGILRQARYHGLLNVDVQGLEAHASDVLQLTVRPKLCIDVERSTPQFRVAADYVIGAVWNGCGNYANTSLGRSFDLPTNIHL